MDARIKVLFLAANPVDTSQLRLNAELKGIDKKIQSAAQRDAFELVSALALTTEDLLQALLRYRPNIVHFSGHGSKSGRIVLENEAGKAHIVEREALTTLFRILKDDIRVVVLNACHSRLQSAAITRVVDYTIGMNTAIGDNAAILFSATFYNALGFGRSVSEGFELARVALQMNFPLEHKTPVLHVRRGIDPASGYLIEQQRSPAPAEILALTERWGKEPDPWKRYWLAISVGNIGGRKAIEALQRMRSEESDEFALVGVDEAMRRAGEPLR